MDEENYFDFCTVCGYDLIVRTKVKIDGVEMLEVGCNECGAILGYEDIET